MSPNLIIEKEDLLLRLKDDFVLEAFVIETRLETIIKEIAELEKTINFLILYLPLLPDIFVGSKISLALKEENLLILFNKLLFLKKNYSEKNTQWNNAQRNFNQQWKLFSTHVRQENTNRHPTNFKETLDKEIENSNNLLDPALFLAQLCRASEGQSKLFYMNKNKVINKEITDYKIGSMNISLEPESASVQRVYVEFWPASLTLDKNSWKILFLCKKVWEKEFREKVLIPLCDFLENFVEENSHPANISLSEITRIEKLASENASAPRQRFEALFSLLIQLGREKLLAEQRQLLKSFDIYGRFLAKLPKKYTVKVNYKTLFTKLLKAKANLIPKTFSPSFFLTLNEYRENLEQEEQFSHKIQRYRKFFHQNYELLEELKSFLSPLCTIIFSTLMPRSRPSLFTAKNDNQNLEGTIELMEISSMGLSSQCPGWQPYPDESKLYKDILSQLDLLPTHILKKSSIEKKILLKKLTLIAMQKRDNLLPDESYVTLSRLILGALINDIKKYKKSQYIYEYIKEIIKEIFNLLTRVKDRICLTPKIPIEKSKILLERNFFNTKTILADKCGDIEVLIAGTMAPRSVIAH